MAGVTRGKGAVRGGGGKSGVGGYVVGKVVVVVVCWKMVKVVLVAM